MTEIYIRDPLVLELSIVAHMVIELLISTTYEMEGDRLEVLLVYSRIKALRGLGSRIKSRARGVLVNVENAIARTQTTPKVGMVFTKYFDGHGEYKGRIVSAEEGDGVKIYKLLYEDDDEEDIYEDEMKGLLKSHGGNMFNYTVDGIVPAFDYLENRLTGNCRRQFSCEHTYDVFRLARVFDPSFVSENEATINQAFVRSLGAIKPLARDDGALLRAMERDIHLYISAARGFTVDYSDVDIFTEASPVLAWWKNHGLSTGAWCEAAEIVFSLTPNSASAERVFSLLKSMFGENQESCLADLVQASIMLRYNKRSL